MLAVSFAVRSLAATSRCQAGTYKCYWSTDRGTVRLEQIMRRSRKELRKHIKTEGHAGGRDGKTTNSWHRRCRIPINKLDQFPKLPAIFDYQCHVCSFSAPDLGSFKAHLQNRQHGGGADWKDTRGFDQRSRWPRLINWSKFKSSGKRHLLAAVGAAAASGSAGGTADAGAAASAGGPASARGPASAGGPVSAGGPASAGGQASAGGPASATGGASSVAWWDAAMLDAVEDAEDDSSDSTSSSSSSDDEEDRPQDQDDGWFDLAAESGEPRARGAAGGAATGLDLNPAAASGRQQPATPPRITETTQGGGWRRVESRSNPGNYYYWHPETGATREEPPLPWEKLASRSQPDVSYYWNPDTGQSMFEKPDM
eukprot:TRINITY_DN9154_c0_g1_i2.p1 TRINITY_DN9154_c0_g1~~TRINITY_DN9154_c0_g1_i2.p1  ORF type:complete len:370 (+),score=52.11 TRINITY_DN9154_c0_g1_i2:288-1397(+)